MKEYTTYQAESGRWMWVITPKHAIVKEWPSKGIAADKAGAEQCAVVYLREANVTKSNPHHVPRCTMPGMEDSSKPAVLMSMLPPVKDPLYVLDTSYFIHRSFHGVREPLKASDGTPTNALYGFCRTIMKLIRNKQPQLLLATLDSGKDTFRHKLYPQYKGDRKDLPDLDIQKPMIEEFLKVCGIRTVRAQGYEADDIIGTVAAKTASQGRKVIVASRDKDIMQVVTEDITLFDPYTDAPIGIKEVQAKFGNPPLCVPDVLGLMGDKADSIPGVFGVGEIKAIKLISEFGSIENLIERVSEVKGKLGETIAENVSIVLLSKKLATIVYDVPITIEPEECGFSIDPIALDRFFRKYGLVSLIKEIPIIAATSSAPKAPANTPEEITNFRGEYSFLSNFFVTRRPIIYDRKEYLTSEHLFQAIKTTDPEWREKVRLAATAGDAKKLGYQVPLRADWEARKIEAMRLCLKLKFTDPLLRAKLMKTGTALLVEGNTWKDYFWGVCGGRGENWLGKLLMELRASFFAEEELNKPRALAA
jgi:ribA/ribD-fused uncharacterized protein